MLSKKRIISISLILMICTSTSVLAEPTKDSLNKQQQQIQDQKSKLNQSIQQNTTNFNDAQNELNTLNIQVQSLDSKLDGLTLDIKDANTKLDSLNKDIKSSEANISKATDELNSQQELFNQRIKVMYLNGINTDLYVVLKSKSLSNLYSNIQAIAMISRHDKKVIKDLADKKTALSDAKAILDKQNSQLQADKLAIQAKFSELQSAKTQQQTLVAQVKTKQKYYASQISGFQQQLNAANKQAQDTANQIKLLAAKEAAATQAKSGSGTSGGRGPSVAPPASTNALVTFAYKYMGTTYVWGGETPSPGFDCSGFMQYVYAHFGISISRTTYTQINEGKAVSRDALQPGDLVFFGTYSDPHHVGMYVGNNCFIHAPQTGDVIKISSLDGTDYLCARRIL